MSHGRELSPESLLHFGSATPYQVVTKRKRQALSAPAAAAITRGDRTISVASTPPDLLTADYGDDDAPATPAEIPAGPGGDTAASMSLPLGSLAPNSCKAAAFAVPEMGSQESDAQPVGRPASNTGQFGGGGD